MERLMEPRPSMPRTHCRCRASRQTGSRIGTLSWFSAQVMFKSCGWRKLSETDVKQVNRKPEWRGCARRSCAPTWQQWAAARGRRSWAGRATWRGTPRWSRTRRRVRRCRAETRSCAHVTKHVHGLMYSENECTRSQCKSSRSRTQYSTLVISH